MRFGVFTLMVFVGVLSGGCGGGETASVKRVIATARGAAVNGPGKAGASSDLVLARDARVRAGRRSFVLLSLPRVGRLLIDCDAADGPSVAFRADRLLPTADVVVDIAGGPPVTTTLQPRRRYQPSHAAKITFQTWHIAPFASAGVRLTVITVAARRLSRRESFGCAASARATVAPSQGPTRVG